jgi:uncharacterized Rossmann fold enzyme
MESSNALIDGNKIQWMHYKDVTLKELPYKYPMRSSVTMEAETRQVRIAVAQGYPDIQLEPLKQETIDIVGFGPSLAETWQMIRHPCITVSGAHDFLCARGFIPDYHAECDGRDHKTKHLQSPNKTTTYLMATICNPRMWDQLEGCNVVTWHNANGKHIVNWIGENDPDKILISGGSVVGLSAIHLAGIMGYRKFRLFGFDGNLRGDLRHAGKHYGPPQRTITRTANGRTWNTTPQMSNACDELIWLIEGNPSLDINVVGTSMMTDIVEDYNKAQQK